MDTQVLVTERVEAGKRFLEALDAAKFPVAAALWLFVKELEKWRYFVATSLVDEKGPLEAYRQLQSLLRQFADDAHVTKLILYDLSVVSPSDERVRLFRRVIDTGQNIRDVRLTDTVIASTVVDDVLIYRLDRKGVPASVPKLYRLESE
ncbi:MAG: hypothetical protein WD673_08000 [Alphaproteobacteria bacterium]